MTIFDASNVKHGLWALRERDVIQRTGLSKSHIRRMVALGMFPAPFKLSERVSVWDQDAVDTWLATKFGRRA